MTDVKEEEEKEEEEDGTKIGGWRGRERDRVKYGPGRVRLP